MLAFVAAALAFCERSEMRIPTQEEFSSIPFDQTGEYVFHFRPSHSREMTLLLEVEASKEQADSRQLIRLQTIIEVTLVDHDGRIVCQATGPPKEGVTPANWVLRSGPNEAAFWHRNCSEIKLRRAESYTLTVRIRDVDPKTPRIGLKPALERSDDFGP